MALIKSITTEIGISANYWKITQINILADRMVGVSVACYIDEQNRLDGYKPVLTRDYTIDISCENPQINLDNPIFAELYTYLKTLPDFDGATDA